MAYPLISVQDSLVPTAVVKVEIFEASTHEELAELINKWVKDTQNLVVCPGPVSRDDETSRMAVTYVSSGRNDDPENRRPPKVEQPSSDATSNGRKFSAKESDGGRIA